MTLILSQYSGELLDQMPENIHLIVKQMQDFQIFLKEDLRYLRLGKLWRDAVYYRRIRMGKDNADNYGYLVQRHGYICDTEFDCAIGYHGQSLERLLNLSVPRLCKADGLFEGIRPLLNDENMRRSFGERVRKKKLRELEKSGSSWSF